MEAQVARGRVRRVGWEQVSRGLHQARGADPLLAWQEVLPPSGAFTGLTAAARHEWWLPPLPSDLPVFACQSKVDPRPRRRGLHVTRHTDAPERLTHSGVALVPPTEALLACARWLGLLDVTVLVDAALHRGSCRRDELLHTASRRRAGAPQLRRALELADGRSESPWESMLRLLHRSCGVEVEPQHVVRTPDGDFVARLDLRLVGTKVAHEYDGAVHLERRTQRSDLRRSRRLGDEGWLRRGYTIVEVLHHPVSILRDADRSLGRPHQPRRILAWNELLDDSLHTRRGTERFRRRLGLTAAEQSGHERQRKGA